MILRTFLIFFSVALSGACLAQNKTISFNDPAISYQGRMLFKPDAAEFSWTGNAASIVFEGTSIAAIMQDNDTANYYQVIVDDVPVKKLHTDTVKRTYLLAAGLSKGKHEVMVYKRTEWDKGKTLFYGFELGKNDKIFPAPAPKKRKMEFYGNSITCGYAADDSSGGDSWFGYYENGYMSYAALTARHFDAQYNFVSKSGIGILISWFPMIMTEMYDRTDPTDPTSKWNFSKYTPDIVVINLFQNDSWLVKNHNHEQFKSRFGTREPQSDTIINAYKDFVSLIRARYPRAHIICALGSMDATREGSPWPGYIEKAVSALNDAKIHTLFFPYKNTGGHPTVREQKIMSGILIKYIEENIKW
ncbi:MAG TPA: SGNH/GDSL hydrolase family protein [Bacteroidales bacterium]|nr:SGNH/GDSL hydrolase family protein [Bacteroidales bacterium]